MGRGHPSRRPWPIGVKLTVRYTAAVAITVTCVALLVYTEVTRRINREAKLLLEVEMRELADETRTRVPDGRWDPASLAALDDRLDRLVRTSDPTLRVGAALVTADGDRPIRKGTLLTARAPVPSAVLSGDEPSSLRAVNLGGSYAYLSMAVAVPGGALQMVLSTERYAENIEQIREVFLLTFPAAILLTAGMGLLLANSTLRPLRRIIETARRISAPNLDARIPLSGSGDELDRLAETLNDMLGRIDESLTRMRRFSANAAHELRTPLTALSSQLDVMLERERTPEDYRHVLAEAHDRVRALSDVVDAMLRLARSEAGLDPGSRVPVPIGRVLENVYEFFEPVADEGGVTLHRTSLPDTTVIGDASWLHQLFANLVSNAIKFTPAGGQVDIRAESREDRVYVTVRDTGPGMSAEDVERAFDRFHRGGAKQTGTGSGLGLAIAREIARAHGGDVDIEESGDAGTTVRVWLPVSATEAEATGGGGRA
jgi:heavy metal sensor kinase